MVAHKLTAHNLLRLASHLDEKMKVSLEPGECVLSSTSSSTPFWANKVNWTVATAEQTSWAVVKQTENWKRNLSNWKFFKFHFLSESSPYFWDCKTRWRQISCSQEFEVGWVITERLELSMQSDDGNISVTIENEIFSSLDYSLESCESFLSSFSYFPSDN